MGRVLVVDDEPDHRTMLQAILRRAEADVVLAGSAEEALDAAALGRLDLAIVDLRLPGRDGLSIMHALRRVQPWLKVVILTAYPTPNSCRIALTEGAAAYIEKPFAPDAFLALIGALLEPGEAGP